MYGPRPLEDALRALGDLLADRGLSYSVVAIGGGALALLGLIERATEDIDLVGFESNNTLVTAEPLPTNLATAIGDVAAVRGLHPKWMNGEPTSLLQNGLPAGFLGRCERRQYGGLTVCLATRYDQIHLKLLAISGPDDKHHRDLKRLAPSAAELRDAVVWVRTQASGEGLELELRAILASFGVELDDA